MQERDKLKTDPITKTEWKNTMENFGMSEAVRAKKEQKRGEENWGNRGQRRHDNNRRAKRGT